MKQNKKLPKLNYSEQWEIFYSELVANNEENKEDFLIALDFHKFLTQRKSEDLVRIVRSHQDYDNYELRKKLDPMKVKIEDMRKIYHTLNQSFMWIADSKRLGVSSEADTMLDNLEECCDILEDYKIY